MNLPVCCSTTSCKTPPPPPNTLFKYLEHTTFKSKNTLAMHVCVLWNNSRIEIIMASHCCRWNDVQWNEPVWRNFEIYSFHELTCSLHSLKMSERSHINKSVVVLFFLLLCTEFFTRTNTLESITLL